MVDASPSNLNLIEKFRIGLNGRPLGFDFVPVKLKMNLFYRSVSELAAVAIVASVLGFVIKERLSSIPRTAKPDVPITFSFATSLVLSNFAGPNKAVVLEIRLKILISPFRRHPFDE
jgi:hypothetical protein